MAHMELAIKLGMHVNLGDVMYYVNNGVKASHGDVQKKKDDRDRKIIKESGIRQK